VSRHEFTAEVDVESLAAEILVALGLRVLATEEYPDPDGSITFEPPSSLVIEFEADLSQAQADVLGETVDANRLGETESYRAIYKAETFVLGLLTGADYYQDYADGELLNLAARESLTYKLGVLTSITMTMLFIDGTTRYAETYAAFANDGRRVTRIVR
jgi:hypothetical protein